MLIVSPRIAISETEFEWTYSRSSGKGGQNVNKVSSKAQLKWGVLETTALTPEMKERFLGRFGNRITKEGELILQSDRFRSQSMNEDDCREKLVEMIRAIEVPPKKRKKTKPSFSQKKKRLETKKKHSDKKNQRRFKY